MGMSEGKEGGRAQEQAWISAKLKEVGVNTSEVTAGYRIGAWNQRHGGKGRFVFLEVSGKLAATGLPMDEMRKKGWLVRPWEIRPRNGWVTTYVPMPWRSE